MAKVSPHEVDDQKESKPAPQYQSLTRMFPGLIIIWLGLSLFLREQNMISNSDWWAYFLLGLGIIFLFDAFVRMIGQPDTHSSMGKLIAGVVLASIGASGVIGLKNWWPLILIGVGVIIILVNLQQNDE
ncbi:MAG: hypothetical protein V2J62_05725 [candidate division KSB1 bacterium]|jgi:hypothetical protein|nr:hypothetical protein [candidate division KSB1 bacterium]